MPGLIAHLSILAAGHAGGPHHGGPQPLPLPWPVPDAVFESTAPILVSQFHQKKH